MKRGFSGVALDSCIGLYCVFFLISCSGPSSKTSMADMYVKNQQDVEKLREREKELKVKPENASGVPDYQVIDNVAVPNLPEYRMGAGDILEIVYHINYEKSPELYLLEVQDRISVTFPYNPQFSTSTLIRSDGRITLPMIGEVDAAGLSVGALTKLLNQKYSRFIRNPSISVAPEEFNVKVEELKKAITTAPRGQSKVAPIAPDGRISMPIIGTLQAQGFTVSELEKIINTKYQDFIRNLHVTLILDTIRNNRVFVLGEVNTPGMIELQGRYDILQVLGQAGYKTSANLSNVLVVRNNGLEKPIVFRVDVENMMTKNRGNQVVNIQPMDVVYVPRSSLDEINDVLAKIFTKGIYTIAPVTGSATYDFSRYYNFGNSTATANKTIQ